MATDSAARSVTADYAISEWFALPVSNRRAPIIPIGTKFDHIEVLNGPVLLGTESSERTLSYVCGCVCGKVWMVRGGNLRQGAKSCGCMKKSRLRHGHSSHGDRHPIYQSWIGMRARCTKAGDADHNYWARGIRVCDEWVDSYETFRDWSFNNGYEHGLTIDRIDNDGDYEPANCRWVDRTVQANNRRSNVHLTAFGETKTIAEWARDERAAVKAGTIADRVRNGVDHETAISIPRIRYAEVL